MALGPCREKFGWELSFWQFYAKKKGTNILNTARTSWLNGILIIMYPSKLINVPANHLVNEHANVKELILVFEIVPVVDKLE